MAAVCSGLTGPAVPTLTSPSAAAPHSFTRCACMFYMSSHSRIYIDVGLKWRVSNKDVA